MQASACISFATCCGTWSTDPRKQGEVLPPLRTSRSTTGTEGLLHIDNVFKALADPTRRRLLDQLHRENGQTLTALCEHMDMTRQAVTQHLRLLEDANL